MGCRTCPSSPDRSIYRSYEVPRCKGGDTKEGIDDLEEWYSLNEPPQSPDFYPDSPLPLDNEEDVTADQAESKKTLRGTPPKQ